MDFRQAQRTLAERKYFSAVRVVIGPLIDECGDAKKDTDAGDLGFMCLTYTRSSFSALLS